MKPLLHEAPLFMPLKEAPQAAITNKGEQILDGMLLHQYRNSPDLREYYMAFISEMDYLFEEIQKVYIGRFLQHAEGNQLDIIGIILQQPRTVILPERYFGFVGAPLSEGFSDDANPSTGGIFRDGRQTIGAITPLDDITYRRVLLVKAMVMNRDVADLNLAYFLIITVLGRVPKQLALRDASSVGVIPTIADREVNLLISGSDTDDAEIQLILYISKYFVPAGITLTLTEV